MKERIARTRRILRRLRLDAFLISNPANIFYLSGFIGNDSYCLITADENYIITDFRYKEEAEKCAPDFKVISEPAPIFKKTQYLTTKLLLKRIGIESHQLTVKEAEVLKGLIGDKLYPTFHEIESLRIVKDDSELNLISKACIIAKKTMNEAAKEIKGGVSEKELAARIDFLLMRNGADRPAFETIAASGPNASMPHARPTSKKIRVSEPLILDFGARFNGYNSDLTRTYFVGKISVYFRLIYNIVRTAQAKAIEKVKPGTKISQVDLAARSYITEKGFGKYFGHGTGHSIGLEVHELPSINSKNHHLLKEGMVFTVEPAIYIPGWGGVRTEDVVVVTSKGYKVLTR